MAFSEPTPTPSSSAPYMHYQQDTPTAPTAVGPTDDGKRAFAVSLGLFLSLAFLLVGYVDGITSILFYDSFGEDYCLGWDGITDLNLSCDSYSSRDEPWRNYTRWYKLVRGAVVMLSLGTLLGAFLSLRRERRYAREAEAPHPSWRIAYALALSVGIVLLLGTLFTIPKSPRWIIRNRDKGAGKAALCTVMSTANIDHELLAIEREIEQTRTLKLTDCSTLKRIAVAAILQFLQQFFNFARVSTVKSVFTLLGTDFAVANSVTTSEFKVYGYFPNEGALDSAVLALVAIVPLLLSAIYADRLGRRKMLTFGSLGMTLGFLAINLLDVATCDPDSQYAFIIYYRCSDSIVFAFKCAVWFLSASFAFSWGPLIWIYPLELFSSQVRARGLALSTALSSTVALLFWKLSPEVTKTRFVIAAVGVLSGLFVWLWYPETKQLGLEDAGAQMGGGGRATGQEEDQPTAASDTNQITVLE